jgi:hypothetical protein
MVSACSYRLQGAANIFVPYGSRIFADSVMAVGWISMFVLTHIEKAIGGGH